MLSYRQAENIAVKVFVVALLVLIAVHTRGVLRAIDARYTSVQSSLSAVER